MFVSLDHFREQSQKLNIYDKAAKGADPERQAFHSLNGLTALRLPHTFKNC